MENNVLDFLEQKIIKVLTSEVKAIIEQTRKNMVVVEEKADGDSATIADIKIGEIFDSLLPNLLSNSIVIQEESFDENVYKNALTNEFVWVVDPIDGTKAFRDNTNFEWCVGICLLDNLKPVLSLVYIPEPWLGEPYLLSANESRKGLYNFGKPLVFNKSNNANNHYVSHIHRDEKRTSIEEAIAKLFKNNETIRAYAGHSTLAQFARVAVLPNNIFSRRSANIWDIIQSAYLVEKNGGEVYYQNGENIFPLNPNLLEFKDNHLLMPFTIASSKQNKEKILQEINITKQQ